MLSFRSWTKAWMCLASVGQALIWTVEGQSPEPRPRNFDCDFQGQFPYMVTIRDNTDAKEYICGGVVISKNAVLTAAHCVDNLTNSRATITPDVYAGGKDRDNPVQKRKTARSFLHPDWTGDILDGDDLVVLKLDEDVCLKPIPTLGAAEAADRKSLTVLTYGPSKPSGPISSRLMHAQFDTLNRTFCNERYDLDPPLKRGDLCMRQATLVGICDGDDGSPLILEPTLLELRDVLIGIVSYATAECTATEGAAVAMDIWHYRRWIQQTLESEEFRKA